MLSFAPGPVNSSEPCSGIPAPAQLAAAEPWGLALFLALVVVIAAHLVGWKRILKTHQSPRLMLARSFPLAVMYSIGFCSLAALALPLSLTQEAGRVVPCSLPVLLWFIHISFTLTSLLLMLVKELIFATFNRMASSFDVGESAAASEYWAKSDAIANENAEATVKLFSMIRQVFALIFSAPKMQSRASFVTVDLSRDPSPRPSFALVSKSPHMSNLSSTTLDGARHFPELDKLDKSLRQQALSPEAFARFSSARLHEVDAGAAAGEMFVPSGLRLDRVAALIASEEQALKLYAFATQRWMLALQGLVFASPCAVVFSLTLAAQPVYNAGCRGCTVYWDLAIGLLCACVPYALAFGRLFFLLAGHSDGFGVVRDVKVCLAVPAALYVTAFALMAAGPNAPYASGAVSWEWLALAGGAFGFAVQVPAQLALVLHGRRTAGARASTAVPTSQNQIAALAKAFEKPRAFFTTSLFSYNL